MAWTAIFHLGDLPLTLSAGAAIAAWLLAGGEGRAAVRWLLAFGFALGVVGASKIAYLGWATGLPALHFKALSGHAAGFAATFPMLCWLCTRGAHPVIRRLAAFGAIAATTGVAMALVVARQHSPAEAAGGWLAGMAACAVTLRRLPVRRQQASGAAAWPVVAFAFCACVTGIVPVGYWMVKAALLLSGNRRPTPWTQQPDFSTMSNRRQACPVHPSTMYPGSDRASSTAARRTRC
jgi:hypothetical protein